MEHRPYQKQLVDKVITTFKDVRSIMMVSPTGSGKSHVGAQIARSFNNVLWVAHRKELLVQAAVALDTIGHKNFTTHSVFARSPAGDYDLLVLDECHHIPTDTINGFLGSTKYAKLLGLSATPRRFDKFAIEVDAVIYGASENSLIDDGYLVPTDLYTIRADALKHTSIINWMFSNKNMIGKTIIFVRTINDAEFFEKSLSLGFNVEIITAESDRESQLYKFQHGILDVLISCLVLTEGTDLPCANTIVIARNTDSDTLLKQMTGRGVRLYPGKESCNVVHCISLLDKKTKSIASVIRPQRHFIVTYNGKWETTLLNMRQYVG
jgi:superfamily II DNA or RNA helicase